MPSSDQTAMLTKYAVVEPNGAISMMGVVDAAMVAMQPGEQVLADTDLDLFGVTKVELPESVTGATHYWDGSKIVAYPDSPGDWAEFDYTSGQWVGTPPAAPTAEEITLAEAARLAQLREAAFLPKLEFALRAVAAGLLSQESALAVLDGKVPAELNGLTEAMSPEELFHLQAKIKGAVQFNRMDPFILAAGDFLGLTEPQMDAVFGISATN